MEIVKARAFARAGFNGNPSDGYFGKTILLLSHFIGLEGRLVYDIQSC